MTLTPWWDCLTLRQEIAKASGNINDVHMSLYAAVHESSSTVYADVNYYSEITHPTRGLVELMGAIAVRLAAPSNFGSVKAIWRGDQGMGGGKSHAEVGLFHMASQPSAFFATDLGKQVAAEARALSGEEFPTELNSPQVVVLPCDRMDPFRPDKKLDNIAESLGERWLWRLVDGDLNRYHAYADRLGTPDGIREAMHASGRPVLTLVDEVLSFVRKATADVNRQDRAQQDMAFLRDLMEATNTSDHAALVIVMIASTDDTVAMGEFGERIRAELEGLLTRYARSIATTSGGDFAEIIRRRLFNRAPAAEVSAAAAASFRQHVAGGWNEQFGQFTWWREQFDVNIARAYPFHPALIDLVEREWASRAGFQRVRSTIQIFAAAVHLWDKRARSGEWAPPLIGLGDLPLSDTKVRQSLLDSGVIPDQKNVTNYREIAANDIVETDDIRGAARRIDVDRSSGVLLQINPRVAERIATAIWLLSLAPRPQGAIGATEAELRVAAFVPDSTCALPEVDAVLARLESPEEGISTLDVKAGTGKNSPRRLVMSTTQTLQMFFKTQRQSVQADDISRVLRDTTRAEMQGSPFDRALFVSAEGFVQPGSKGDALTTGLLAAIESAGIDAAETRMIVLDPTEFTLLNGVDSETRIAVSASLGINRPDGWSSELAWPRPSSVVYPSSCVFVLVNTQRRSHAVAAATDVVAWERVGNIANVSTDVDLAAQAKANLTEKRDVLRTRLRRAFQHIVYLGESRTAVTAKLDQDAQSALNGNVVWATLAERDKAFERGQFTKTALLYQMEDRYWGKSLATLHADFYRNPRLPLLFDGDTDLKSAIFAATRSNPPELVLKDKAGEIAEAGTPADINLKSDLQLDRYEEPAASAAPGSSYDPGSPGSGTGTSVDGGQPPGTSAGTPATPVPGTRSAAAERKVVVSLTGSAFDTEVQRAGANDLLSQLIDLIDRGHVTYGKMQLEFIVPADQAEALTEAARRLGASASSNDV